MRRFVKTGQQSTNGQSSKCVSATCVLSSSIHSKHVEKCSLIILIKSLIDLPYIPSIDLFRPLKVSPLAMALTVGFTIGSSPYDESCKKRRKAAATALAKPAMRKYLPMFDLETFCVIRDYWRMTRSSESEFNPRPFLQRFALNTTLTLCYGIRMDDAYDELLREILCMTLYEVADGRCRERDIVASKCLGELSRLHSCKKPPDFLKPDTAILPR
jgi:hypothetical protein